MKFFDTTPTAWILNRFSKDMDEGKWAELSEPSPPIPQWHAAGQNSTHSTNIC